MKKVLLLALLLVVAASAAITITFPDGPPTTVGIPVKALITADNHTTVDLAVNPGEKPWVTPYEDVVVPYTGDITITHDGSGLTLFGSKGGETGESESFNVGVGTENRWQILAPGETADPGNVLNTSGKTGSASVTAAGDSTYTINVCDAYFNVVSGSSLTPAVTCTDTFADLGTPVIGSNTFELRAAGSQTLTVTGGGLTDDASTVNVVAGDATQLLVICGGEKHVPGDTTSTLAAYPGKADDPGRDFGYLGTGYEVDIFAVDVAWNRVSSYSSSEVNVFTGTENLTDSTVNAVSSGQALDVPVWFTAADITVGIPIVAIDGSLSSYTTPVKVYQAVTEIQSTLTPNTVPEGVHSALSSVVFVGSDRAGAGVEVSIELIDGDLLHFFIEDAAPETNTEGVCTTDVWADTAGIYIIQSTAGIKTDVDTLVVEERPGLTVMPNPFKYSAHGDIPISFSYKVAQAGAAEVLLLIADIYGNVVHKATYTSGNEVSPGQQEIEWDGMNSNGNRVVSGMYQAVMKITLTNLSSETLKKNFMVIW